MKNWVIFSGLDMGSLSALVCGLYPYPKGHWINQSPSPPRHGLVCVCSWVPVPWCVSGAELCLPCWARGCPAPQTLWAPAPPCCPHRKTTAHLSSVLVQHSLKPGCTWHFSVCVSPAWNSHKVWKPWESSTVTHRAAQPKLGAAAVSCSSQSVFWVTLFNFTTQSIQNSWEIPLEIQNSLGVFISSNFSEQGTKAI